ncbi:MAG: radical SAM protein [bacterium]|jgi:histone acetyltransferase (RNA polymerase elongator complex component)|nr:radical SAM protein [bacterium]
MKVLPFYLPHQGCPHQCVYCNQPLIINTPSEEAQWGERLDQLHRVDPRTPWEIAFYGGTFSALPRETIERCLATVRPYLALPHVVGVRISTRPDSLNGAMLDWLQAQGVTTIELGGESFDDRVLRKAARGHTQQQFLDACHAIQSREIRLGLHLMCGLPGQSEDSWRETIATAVDIQPDMVRFAPTLILKDTPLEQLYRQGRYTPLPYAEALDQCAHAYCAFFLEKIPIIRVGLALSDPCGDGVDKLVAGPWHPALRHEVESLLVRRRIEAALRESTETTIRIHPKDLSITQGGKRCNLTYWRVQLSRPVTLSRDEEQPRTTFSLGNRGYSLFLEG